MHLPTIGVPPQSNVDTGWLDQITILQLATHTAGFEKDGGFGKLMFQPGTTWSYSDGGANWLADALTQVYGEDLDSLLFSRVFTTIGITSDMLVWRDNSSRTDKLNGVKRREMDKMDEKRQQRRIENLDKLGMDPKGRRGKSSSAKHARNNRT